MLTYIGLSIVLIILIILAAQLIYWRKDRGIVIDKVRHNVGLNGKKWHEWKNL